MPAGRGEAQEVGNIWENVDREESYRGEGGLACVSVGLEGGVKGSPRGDQFTNHHLPAWHNTNSGSRPQRKTHQ